MRIVYKIYKIDTVDVGVEVHTEAYGYGHTRIAPTVLREVYQEDWQSKDTFDTEAEAEQYIQNNLIKEYGDTYTILKEYRYD